MLTARTTSLRARVLRGMLWSWASFALGGALVMVSTAVLAHLVSPRDFGLVALALIVTSVLDALRDLGLNQALVVTNGGETEALADAAFRFSILIAGILALVVAAVSPLAAALLHQPRLVGLLAVLGLNLPLRSLGLTHYALAQRRLDFRTRTAAELAEVIVRGGVGIGLALSGGGPWSLVLGYLAGTSASTVVLWARVEWRPARRHRTGPLSQLIRFGGPLTVVGFIGTAMSYVDNLFVGAVLGPAALGVYSLGYRLPETLVVDVVSAAGLVLFPAFAMVDGPALRRSVMAASRYALLLGIPVTVALIVLAHPLVLALFGRRWHEAAPVIQILGVGFLGWPTGQVVGSAYMAAGRVGVMVKLAVPQGIMLVALIAIFVHDGLVAVAWCQAAVRVTFVAIGVYVSTRVLGLRARELWRVSWPPAAAAAGMAAVILPLHGMLASPWPSLLASTVAGAVVYIGLARVLAGDALPGLWALIRGGELLGTEGDAR